MNESLPEESVVAVVEIPRGSRNKYEYDRATGEIRIDRVLSSSVHYPTDYGLITETLHHDGDEHDILIMVEEPTFPGCHVVARPIGMLQVRDVKGEDSKYWPCRRQTPASRPSRSYQMWSLTGCAR